jgi:hypothetical protein
MGSSLYFSLINASSAQKLAISLLRTQVANNKNCKAITSNALGLLKRARPFYENGLLMNQLSFYSTKLRLNEIPPTQSQQQPQQQQQKQWTPSNENHNELLNRVSPSSSLNSNLTASRNSNDNEIQKATSDPSRKPTTEQLLIVKEKLMKHVCSYAYSSFAAKLFIYRFLLLKLPKFLTEVHPYSLYTADVIFENFYKEPGKITV